MNRLTDPNSYSFLVFVWKHSAPKMIDVRSGPHPASLVCIFNFVVHDIAVFSNGISLDGNAGLVELVEPVES